MLYYVETSVKGTQALLDCRIYELRIWFWQVAQNQPPHDLNTKYILQIYSNKNSIYIYIYIDLWLHLYMVTLPRANFIYQSILSVAIMH